MTGNEKTGFQTWTLQFNLLASYFTAYNQTREQGQNLLPLFSSQRRLFLSLGRAT